MSGQRLPQGILVSICYDTRGQIHDVILAGSEGMLPERIRDNKIVQMAFALGAEHVELFPPFVDKKRTYHKLENFDTIQPNENGLVARTLRYTI